MKKFFNRKNFIYTIVLTLLLLGFFLYKDFSNVISALSQANFYWLSLGVLCMIGYWILEAQIFYAILRKYTSDISYGKMFKLTLATQFFNGVTPFATGGQPFQIYILNNESKLELGKITSASVQNFIVYQIALVIYVFIALLIHIFHPLLSFGKYSTLVIITGFSINIILIIGIVLLSINQKFLNFISGFGISLLAKLHIIKNKQKSMIRLLRFTQSFSENMKQLKNNPFVMIEGILVNMLRLTLFYLVSYFVCRALGLNKIGIISVITASTYTLLINSVVPLPGAAAGAEFGFLAFFNSIIAGPLATAIMLVWRFITYYIGLTIGFIAFFFGYTIQENTSE